MKSDCRVREGFTLLEVMVALLILAIAAAALLSATSFSLKQQSLTENKTFASWVAENRLTEIRTARFFPSAGTSDDTVFMADKQWHLRVTVAGTPRADMRKIVIDVRLQEPPDATPLYSLTGFLGKY